MYQLKCWSTIDAYYMYVHVWSNVSNCSLLMFELCQLLADHNRESQEREELRVAGQVQVLGTRRANNEPTHHNY